MSQDVCLEKRAVVLGESWYVVETRSGCDRPVTGKRRVTCTLKASSLAAVFCKTDEKGDRRYKPHGCTPLDWSRVARPVPVRVEQPLSY